jgi:hypothetical protein
VSPSAKGSQERTRQCNSKVRVTSVSGHKYAPEAPTHLRRDEKRYERPPPESTTLREPGTSSQVPKGAISCGVGFHNVEPLPRRSRSLVVVRAMRLRKRGSVNSGGTGPNERRPDGEPPSDRALNFLPPQHLIVRLWERIMKSAILAALAMIIGVDTAAHADCVGSICLRDEQPAGTQVGTKLPLV